MKRGKVILAVDKTGQRLFVHLKYSLIGQLAALCSGIPLVFFGPKDGPYLDVRKVIDWHEKELAESGGRSGSRLTVDALKVAMEKPRRGEIEIV